MLKDSLRQCPNILSGARLLLALAFPFFPPSQRLLVIFVALFTEYADGALARACKWESRLGEFLDPIADKFFVGMVLLTMLWTGSLGWWEACLVVGRDLVVTGAALWYWASRAPVAILKMQPSWPGKCATTLQFALLVALGAGWRMEPLIDATALVSIYAGMDYIVRFESPVA